MALRTSYGGLIMTTPQPTREELEVFVAQLMAENAKLKANGKSNIKVSTKGAVSVYGMGRWPVTLYKSQWLKLFDMVEQIKDFIEANDSLLSVKAE
jgi:hypothetical protein